MSAASQDTARVVQMIGALPAESQTRVMVIVGILREMLEADETGEVELAFTLVLSELAEEK